MVGSVRDPLFRRVQQPGPFTAVAKSFPLVAEWVDTDASEPITDIMPMGSIRNRMTRFRRDDSDAPVGVINTSDSFASTNPSLGRGIGISADLAVRLRDLPADEPDPIALVDRWDDIQQQWHRPWLDDSIASDANMRDAIDALVEGRRSSPPVEWRSNLGAAERVDADCCRDRRRSDPRVADVLARRLRSARTRCRHAAPRAGDDPIGARSTRRLSEARHDPVYHA